MSKLCLRTIFIFFVIFVIFPFVVFGKSKKDFQDKMEVLNIAKIIDDKEGLDEPIKRSQFAKMIVMASENKDKATGLTIESVCNDVNIYTNNANYIKIAIDNAYMFTYLGGLFKPDDSVTFSDLSRACLSLLGYKDSDFTGNKVIARNNKFVSLGLNENIDKNGYDILTKKDIINGIYNTLKENVKDTSTIYGIKTFKDMVVDSDNELNAIGMINKKVSGPFFANINNEISMSFNENDNNIYLNGIKSKLKEIEYDIYNYGYAIYYIDTDNNILYAYTERDDIVTPIKVIKGYVQNIYYNASDLTTPYRVDIDLHKLSIESEEMKFEFSASGSFKINDYVVVICNKMNDITKAYLNINNSIEYNQDETEPYNGSIVNAFLYDSIK